ncbi:MAG: hypothetical protein ACLROW_14680 [Roseburia faecis]
MKHKNIKIALSVFLTAFAFGLNITGISPVLGVLNTKYHAYGTSMVQMLQTLPYLFIMVGSFSIGWLTTKISKKDYYGRIAYHRCVWHSSVFY